MIMSHVLNLKVVLKVADLVGRCTVVGGDPLFSLPGDLRRRPVIIQFAQSNIIYKPRPVVESTPEYAVDHNIIASHQCRALTQKRNEECYSNSIA